MARNLNSLRLNLLRLKLLLERVESEKVTAQEIQDLKDALGQLQRDLSEIRKMQEEREEKIQKALNAIKLLKNFAKNADLPKDGKINWVKVLQLDRRGGYNIYVMSKGKNLRGEDYAPGVYYTEFGSRYGYDNSDFISKLDSNLLRKIELTNEQLDKFIQRADEIVNKQDFRDDEWRNEEVEKYKSRWPEAKEFELTEFQIYEDPPFSGKDIENLAKEFDVEIKIIDRSGKSYNMVVFGPSNTMEKFEKKYLLSNKNIEYSSGGFDEDLGRLLFSAGLTE
jgi:hypothetical protein